MDSLGKLTTEGRNPASHRLDQMTAREIVALMNKEDTAVPEAIARIAGPIATAIDVIADRLRKGGRLVYLGAGTSGRLGVLDASECPPTFNTPPEMVVGIIAGGDGALRRAAEGAEDVPESAVHDLQCHHLSSSDVLVGIATSGRTPYVLGGLKYARQIGCFAIGFSCNEGSALEQVSDLVLCPVVGPEILSGSTRMKSGTATKMVLNMLTTGTMVRLGKTYGNLMVDLRATNQKLTERTQRIVGDLTQLPADEVADLLELANGELKTAVVMHALHCDATTARQRLADQHGQLRNAIESPCD